jgi:hypothetical protein
MCHPAFAIGGLALGAVGTSMQIQAQIQAGNKAREMAERNAQLKQQRATTRAQRGREASIRNRIKVAGLNSLARARLAASGVAVGSGNALQIQAQNEIFGEFDSLMILTNANRDVHFMQVGAEFTRYEGRVREANARARAVSTGISGFGGLTFAGALALG